MTNGPAFARYLMQNHRVAVYAVVIVLLALLFGGPGGCPTQTRADFTGIPEMSPLRAKPVLDAPKTCPVLIEVKIGDHLFLACPDEEIMIRTPSAPSIMAPEQDRCIFASDVQRGIHRWRPCPIPLD